MLSVAQFRASNKSVNFKTMSSSIIFLMLLFSISKLHASCIPHNQCCDCPDRIPRIPCCDSCCPPDLSKPCNPQDDQGSDQGGNGMIDITDPCEYTDCPDGFKCDDGSCLICGPDERCKSCASVYCPKYFKCQQGVCVPDEACKNVRCPPDTYCEDGKCVRHKTFY